MHRIVRIRQLVGTGECSRSDAILLPRPTSSSALVRVMFQPDPAVFSRACQRVGEVVDIIRADLRVRELLHDGVDDLTLERVARESQVGAEVRGKDLRRDGSLCARGLL